MTTKEILDMLDNIKAELLRRLDAEKRAPDNKRLGRVTQIVRSGNKEGK